MNRFTIARLTLGALLAAGCALEQASDDEDQTTQGSEVSERASLATSTDEPASTGDSLSFERNPNAPPGKDVCANCGPLPNPWQNMGPLPNPWTSSSGGTSTSGGGSGGTSSSGGTNTDDKRK